MPPTTASTGRSAGAGRAQFVAIHQRGDDADNGIEADNNEFNNDAAAAREPADLQHHDVRRSRIATRAARAPRAILFRRGTAVTFRNFLDHRLQDAPGMQIDDDRDDRRRSTNGTTQMGAGVIWGIATPTANASTRARRRSSRAAASRTSASASTAACRPTASTTTTPNFRPTLGRRRSPAASCAPIQPPNDGFFEPVTFIGAVRPARRRLDDGLDVLSAAMMDANIGGSRQGAAWLGCLAAALAAVSLLAGTGSRFFGLQLQHTHASPKAVAEAVVAALDHRDVAALEHLAVSELEFRAWCGRASRRRGRSATFPGNTPGATSPPRAASSSARAWRSGGRRASRWWRWASKVRPPTTAPTRVMRRSRVTLRDGRAISRPRACSAQ